MLDREGKFKERTEAYLAEHPDASFDEVEAHCFPGEDGELALLRDLAAPPRGLRHAHLPGARRGRVHRVLEPGRHYLELKRDLSNLDEVLESHPGRRAAG